MHCCCCCCLVASVMSDSESPYCQAPLSMDSLGKSTRVGCQALLQGIFLTQGWNPVPCILGRFFITEPPGEPLRRIWWGLISTLMITHYYGKTFLSTLPNASWIRRSAWWVQALFPTLCELWALYPPNPFGWFFLWSQVVSRHAWANQCSAKDSRGILCISLEFFFSAALSSLTLCPIVSICSLFSESQLCFLKPCILLGSTWVPFPASELESFLKAVSWVFIITGLILPFYIWSNA